MKRIVSLIIVLSVLMNFILSSFSFAATKTISVTEGNSTYSFADSEFEKTSASNSPHVQLTVPEKRSIHH